MVKAICSCRSSGNLALRDGYKLPKSANVVFKSDFEWLIHFEIGTCRREFLSGRSSLATFLKDWQRREFYRRDLIQLFKILFKPEKS